jgi:hypothetical protein
MYLNTQTRTSVLFSSSTSFLFSSLISLISHRFVTITQPTFSKSCMYVHQISRENPRAKARFVCENLARCTCLSFYHTTSQEMRDQILISQQVYYKTISCSSSHSSYFFTLPPCSLPLRQNSNCVRVLEFCVSNSQIQF